MTQHLTIEPFNVLVESRHGPMLVNKNDIYVGGSFLTYGEFSHGETELFESLIKPGMVVVNVGANIGAHAVRLAQLCFPGACYAFEPQRSAWQLLVANAALHSLDNMSPMQCAVSDHNGFVNVPLLDPRARQNFGGLELSDEEPGQVVGCMTIDNLQLQRLNFLMADVEGMETAVLRGARETIERCLPIIYVEADRQPQQAGLLAVLEEFGYAAYWHMPPLYNPNNFFRCAENIFPNVVSINWLAVPEERDMHPSWVRVTLDQIQPAATEAP